MTSLHDRLKEWLIILGKDNGYDAWTTDVQNNVEFSKIRNTKVDYRPDAVWKNRRTGAKVFFELAFQEDYRQIVGEVFLASQVETFSKIYVIRPTEEEKFWKDVESFLRLAFKEDGIFKTYKSYRPSFIIFERNLKEDEIKNRIVQALIDDKWIKKQDSSDEHSTSL